MRALTDRETQVLRLLADGHTQTAIARRLAVTDRTIRRITAALYTKLGARTAAQAVAMGYRLGTGLGDDIAIVRRARTAGYRLALIRREVRG